MESNVGRRVLELRNRRGYTQEQLAEIIGTTPSYISNIERENKCPSLKFLRKLVNALDTTYDYLLIGDFKLEQQLEINYKEMFKEIEKLNKETQLEFFRISNEIITSLKNMENN